MDQTVLKESGDRVIKPCLRASSEEAEGPTSPTRCPWLASHQARSDRHGATGSAGGRRPGEIQNRPAEA